MTTQLISRSIPVRIAPVIVPDTLLAPPGALPRRPPPPWNEQRAGSLITLNSLTVAIGVQLWLDLLAGRLRSSHWHRLRWEPGVGLQADFAPVGASPGCRICHGERITL